MGFVTWDYFRDLREEGENVLARGLRRYAAYEDLGGVSEWREEAGSAYFAINCSLQIV